MNKTINITVKDKIATAPKDAEYICGNSDYLINFDFDSEWDEFETKTAMFVWKGGTYKQVFTGNVCPVPVISKTYSFDVGVFAGNLHTTTPAYVPAKKSILCEGGTPADPPDDVYNQIMERLNELGTTDPEAIAAAVADYIAANPIEEKDPTVPAWAKAKEKPEYTAKEVGAIAETELQNAINTALEQAKESGEFDGAQGPQGDKGEKGDKGDKGDPGAAGADGKSAYAYAVEGGYTGTEAEFAAKLAAEMPEALPNPYPLELIDPDTGETLASYDGSEAVTVEIPSGGGGGSGYTYNATYTVEEDVDSYFAAFPTRDCKKILLNISCATTPSTAPTFMIVIDSHKPAGAISLTTTTFLWAEISVFFDVTRYYYTSTHGAANNVSARTHNSAFLNYAYASDDGFVITSLPAGTVIEIWGVKK